MTQREQTLRDAAKRRLEKDGFVVEARLGNNGLIMKRCEAPWGRTLAYVAEDGSVYHPMKK